MSANNSLKNVVLAAEASTVEFVLLPRETVERSQRVSKWDKVILPKLKGKSVTIHQMMDSLEKMEGRKPNRNYVYAKMNRWVAQGVCKKVSAGAYDKYVFPK